MSPKNAFLIVLAGISPYIISNYFVLVFLAPILAHIYSNKNFNIYHMIFLPLAISSVALLPSLAFKPAAYFIGVGVTTGFSFLFLATSKFLIKRLDHLYFSVFIPPLIWTALIYLLDVKSLVAAAFNVGVLIPLQAPLIWYIGSIGITLLIVLFNSAFARYLAKKDKFSFALAIFLSGVFVFSHFFSLTANAEKLHRPESAKKIALIQGDIPRTSLLGYEDKLSDRIERYINLSRESLKGKPDLIVWPEYAVPVDIVAKFPQFMPSIEEAAKKSNSNFIIGTILQDRAKENHSYDAVLMFDKKGKIQDVYYSEDPAIFSKNVYPGKNEKKIFFGNVGIALCWEEISSDFYRSYINQGAEYILSLTSNADFDYSWLKRYCSFFTRARAAENMRYIARATQTGITQIVNPFGKIIKSIPTAKSSYLVGEIYGIEKKSFYSAHGDILTKVFMAGFVGLIGVEYFFRRWK